MANDSTAHLPDSLNQLQSIANLFEKAADACRADMPNSAREAASMARDQAMAFAHPFGLDIDPLDLPQDLTSGSRLTADCLRLVDAGLYLIDLGLLPFAISLFSAGGTMMLSIKRMLLAGEWKVPVAMTEVASS